MVKLGTVRVAAALLAALAVTIAGCSLTRSEEDPVQIKLNDLDARLARIERVMSNQSLLEMAQRLDAEQAEVRTLRGQIDELQNGAAASAKQQRDLYADLDRRLTEHPTANTAGSSPGATSVPAGGEQAAYTQAFEALKGSHYPDAIAGFKQFLTSYPSSSLADNAQYWLGEAYYVMRDYDNAGTAFQTVGERWPNSRKAPDALVKLGFTQYELKHYSQARATLTEVTQRYPDSDAAKLAAERLKRLSADAH